MKVFTPVLLLVLLAADKPLSTFTLGEPPPVLGERYDSAKETQTIFILNDRDVIRKAPIDKDWHHSGGLEKINPKLWKSEKSRHIPGEVRYWVGDLRVKNGIMAPNGEEYTQLNRAIRREYPPGTVFTDVLKNEAGEVFEQRVREKLPSGTWRARVTFTDEKARPQGYAGLAVTCASCHDQAGTGKYGSGDPPKGLVPGGDTVFSDPLDWSVWYGKD